MEFVHIVRAGWQGDTTTVDNHSRRGKKQPNCKTGTFTSFHKREMIPCDRLQLHLPLFLMAVFDGSVVGIPCTPKQNKVTNNTSFTVNFMLLTLIKPIWNQKIIIFVRLDFFVFRSLKLCFFIRFPLFCCYCYSTKFIALFFFCKWFIVTLYTRNKDAELTIKNR